LIDCQVNTDQSSFNPVPAQPLRGFCLLRQAVYIQKPAFTRSVYTTNIYMKTMLRRVSQSRAFVSLYYFFLAKGRLAKLTESPAERH
jgi:hypothetical protein